MMSLHSDLTQEDDARDLLWRTREGQVLAIRDMGDGHLLACINCLRDRSPIGTKVHAGTPENRRRYLNAMANEAYRRRLRPDDLTEGEPVHE